MTGQLVVTVLAAVLLAAAAVKLVTSRRGGLSWPQGPNFLKLHVPLPAVLVGEVLAGTAPLWVERLLLSGLVLGVAFALITLAALTLQGRECACFGIPGMRVGTLHVAGCAAAAVAGLGVAVLDPAPVAPATRALLLLVTTSVASAALLLGGRVARRQVEVSAGACLRTAVRVEILTSATCTACAGLKLLYAGGPPHPAVRWSELGPGDEHPRVDRRDLQFPCALAYDEADTLTCPPQQGLAECHTLLQQFAAPAVDVAR